MYKTLIIEIRPLLHSVNVYIILNEAHNEVKVNLNTHNFEIVSNESCCVIECAYLNINKNSLCIFKANGEHLAFRFSTNPAENLPSNIAKLVQPLKNTPQEDGPILLKTEESYEIMCSNCKNILCKKAVFKRVLPLPSENLELSSWFCHGHDTSIDLNPKIADIFYTETYAHINALLLSEMRKSDKILVCKRCLSWLGFIINQASYRIWFNTVIFNFNGMFYCQQPLDATFLAIKKIINSSLMSSARILVHCQSSDNSSDYVLLWIIEPRLKAVIENCDKKSDCNIAKVLFRYEKTKGGVVNQWLQDVNVSNLSASKVMIVELLRILYKYNKLLPKDYSFSNDFYVSYIPLYT